MPSQLPSNNPSPTLVVDVGGTSVKILATGETERRKAPSGPTMTPTEMVETAKRLAEGWRYERASVGYPGLVHRGKAIKDPHNLGPGWVDFDFAKAFGCPVLLINDAAMQALGSYNGGSMLFLGLGTGLGSALIVDGVIQPMELAHLPYRKGRTYEDYVGEEGLQRLGKKKWHEHVARVVGLLRAALVADDVVIGGGNSKMLDELPEGCRLGDNANAFVGGFRMWEQRKPV